MSPRHAQGAEVLCRARMVPRPFVSDGQVTYLIINTAPLQHCSSLE